MTGRLLLATLLGALAAQGQAPLPGVRVSLSTGEAATTDAQGYYSIEVPVCWTGQVAPKLSGYLMTPTSISRTCLKADLVANFVANSSDVKPPTVKITNPSNNGSLVRQPITLKASATDNISVAGVQFLVDGAPLGGEITVGPYQATWDASKTAAKSWHAISATSRDLSGNSATTQVRVKMR